MTAIDFQALLADELQKACEDAPHEGLLQAFPPQQPAPVELAQYRLPCPVPDVFLIPEFINAEQEAVLIAEVRGLQVEWKHLGHRWTAILGGIPDAVCGMVPEALPPFVTAVTDLLRGRGVCCDADAPNHVLLNWYEETQGIAPHKDGPLYRDKVAILSLGTRTDRLDFWSEQPRATPVARADDGASERPGGEGQEGGSGRGPGQGEGKAPQQAASPSSGGPVAGGPRGECQYVPEPAFSVVLPARSLLVFQSSTYTGCWHGIVGLRVCARLPCV